MSTARNRKSLDDLGEWATSHNRSSAGVETNRRRTNARGRALARLAKAHRKEYERYLAEEKSNLGVGLR